MASIKEQLTKIAVKQVRLSNGDTVATTMAKEARRLYDCIQYYIDRYYESYQPKIYERTEGYKRALYAEGLADIRVVGNTLHISVGFQTDLATHPNLSGIYRDDLYGGEYWIPIKDRHNSFVPLMMEFGWHSPRLASMIGEEVPRLTYFAGINAVEKGIRDFNKTNKFGIKINADDFFNGKAY